MHLTFLVLFSSAGLSTTCQSTNDKTVSVPADAAEYPLPVGAITRLGTLRLWQRPTFGAVAISPDEGVVATGGANWGGPTFQDEHGVFLWSAVTGRRLAEIAKPGHIRSLCFAHDGHTLAGAGRDAIHVWKIDNRRVQRYPIKDAWLDPSSFSSDNKQLFCGTNQGMFCQWDLATSRILKRWTAPRLAAEASTQTISSSAISTSAKLLAWEVCVASGCKDEDQFIWLADFDGNRHHKLKTASFFQARCLAFSGDGKLLASGGDHVYVWDTSNGKLLRKLKDKSPVSLAFSPDGHFLVTTHQNESTFVWDVRNGRKVCDFAFGSRFWEPMLVRAAFSKVGRSLILATPSTVHIVDTSTWRTKLPFLGHRDPVSHLEFSYDQRYMYSQSTSLSCAWDTNVWKEEWRSGLLATMTPLATSFKQRAFIASADSGVLQLRSSDSGKLIRTFHDTASFDEADFSADGALVLFSRRLDDRTRGTTAIFSVHTGKRIRSIDVKEPATPPVFSPNGDNVIWLGNSGTLYVVKGDNGAQRKFVGSTNGEKCMFRCSMDGNVVAILPAIPSPIGPKQEVLIKVWRLPAEKEIQRIRIPRGKTEWAFARSIAVSHDGRTIAVGSTHNSDIQIYEVASRKERLRLTGHHDSVASLAFSGDGRWLASGSDDNTIVVWDVMNPWRKSFPQRDSVNMLTIWSELASSDARRAYEAMWMLTQAGNGCLQFLREKVYPVPKLSPSQIARLIETLANENFKVREDATEQLWYLAESAQDPLERALKKDLPGEARKRLQGLLKDVNPFDLSLKRIRLLRAIEVLERIGSDEVCNQLQTLARGHPEARLTQEAAESLARLRRKLP